MKNFISIILISLVLIFLIFIGIPTTQTKEVNGDILRIHIRANSNSEEDQSIKYKIKDLLLEYVSGEIEKLSTKKEVEDYFIKHKTDIENLVNGYLKNKGFNYQGVLNLTNEYFPTRMYGNKVVNSGYYDAIILSLGETKGENWWCVAYPTLCFEEYNANSLTNVVYKSRLMDIINKILLDKE